MELYGNKVGHTEGTEADQSVVAGEYVVCTLIAEFTIQVERKVDALLQETESSTYSSSNTLHKDRITRSLQRGEDPQFDQLLSSLGCVAEHCLPSLLTTLFKWYEHQLPNTKRNFAKDAASEGKQHKTSTKSKSDSAQIQCDARTKHRETAVQFVFCLVLIEVLHQLPVHPLPDWQIRSILTYAFNSFYDAPQQKNSDSAHARIVADLYAEVIGVLAQSKFQAVRNKFMYELLKERDKEASTDTILAFIVGMKFFRVRMYPVEDFEASFRFLQELANYSLDVKNREIKHALAGLFVEILVPVAAAVKTEVNVPVLRDFVDSLYPTSLELSKRQKNKLAMYPLVTCLLCVSQKQFFLNNWHIFLDNCLSTLKSRDQKLSRVALESLYRLLWVYMVRIKCESNIATQSRLQSIVKSLFPVGSRNVVPKDTPLNIFVKIIQFIAQERLDFAMKEIVLDLLSISLSGSRSSKQSTIHPERMNIGLRAFLVITDSLQQKDGAPPMPSTVGVMPSGNTLRVKKTFLNKTLTEDEARTIGVSHYHKHVQKALDGILQSLDMQVGQRMMMTNSQFSSKDPQDLLTGEHKPKIELFRTCVAAIPRLMPTGMSHSDLLEMLSRLTVHVDEELRSRAFSALQSFAVDFPTLREEVVATFLSFVLKQVSDVHNVLLDGSLKMLVSLINAWKNNASNAGSTNTASTRYRHKSSAYSELPINNSSMFLSNGTCIYAPLINRVEGFALVLLCSSRSMTRKLACHILKEIRSLAHCFGYGKADDTLCLDVLDKLCPEVTEEITNNQKGLSFGAPGREYVLSIATKQDLAALVECSSNWHEHDGLHPWILFMSAFLDPSRLVALCAKALSFAWGDVYIRLSQIQQHTDSAMTSSNKKVIPAPGSSDHSLMLWTNYLVFACKCAPSSTSIKQKQQKESAIPAGTPDWRVALTRDSERLTALPSMLFQRLITQLRADGSVAHREAAVIGLGSTSVASFRDLMTELLTVIHEACECKKQENIRRKRKRDGVRAVLAKVFARLATHKVLSKGILADSEKLSGSSVKPCKQIIEDYIDEMRLLLEAADRSESSGSALNPITASQQPPQIGLLSSQNSMIAASSSTLIDLRIHFAEMITQLIKHLPLNKRSKFLSPETRKSLFLLFSGWCNKFSSGKNLHLTDFDELNSDMHTLMYITALRAECAVLCCGPVFEKSAISSTNGYLFTWLEALLDCPNSHVYNIGREAVVLLLHFNPAVPDLLSWLINKCYTGTPLVSTGCFLGISTQFANSEYNCDCISMLFLTLYKIGYHEHMISETAEHLLVILLSRHFSTADVNENLTETMKRNSSTYKNPRKILGSYSKFGGHSAPLYSLSQVKLSEELARSHPEFTMSFLAELFIRFPTASDVGQRQMLQFILPWLQNVELIPLASSSNISSSDDHRQAHDLSSSVRNSGSQSHPWLPNEGWGSEEATLNVLNNLMYITTCYHMKLNAEIEKCWVTLCDTWPKNLSSCLEFLLALLSVHSSEELMKSTRLVISYLARAKSSKVIKFLIKECQIAEPVWTVCESSPKAPFYKIVSANSGSCNETCYSDTSTTTSPTTAKRASSAHNIGAMSKRENLRMSSVSAPGTQSDRFCSPNEKNEFVRPNKLNSQEKRGSAMISEDLEKRVDSLDQVKIFIKWRAFVEENMQSQPLPMPSGEILLPLSPNYISENGIDDVVGILRSNVACMLLSELVLQHGINIDWKAHLPVVFLSLVLNLDQVQVPEVPIHCQRLLANIIMKLCPHVNPTQVGRSVISSSVDSAGHSLVSQPLSSLIQDPSVMSSEAATPLSIGQISFPVDSGISSPSSTSSLKGSVTHSATDPLSSSSGQHSPIGQISEQHSSSEDSVNALVHCLIISKAQPWDHEDVTSKNTSIKSADKLITFVQKTVKILETELPSFNLKERLGYEALRFVISLPSKHHANRALQIFRALKLPLPPALLSDLVQCMVLCISEGNDAESQGHMIELLSTFLHACDTPPSPEKDKEDIRQQRSRSFTPDLSWRLSVGASEPSPTSTPTISTAHVVKNAPALAVLPNLTKPITAEEVSQHPTSPVTSPNSPSGEGLPRNSTAAPGRMGHAHKRSGSVTLTQKMIHEASQSPPTSRTNRNSYPTSPPSSRSSVRPLSCSPPLPKSPPVGLPQHSVSDKESDNPVKSPVTLRKESGEVCQPRILHSSPIPTAIHKTQSADTICSHQKTIRVSDTSGHGGSAQPVNSTEEWKNMLAQMLWIGVALLESDYEHEFLLAVQLIERVLHHLPLQCKEGRFRIERYLCQIKWNKFCGIQHLLLKGLTSAITLEASFRLLSSLITVSNLSLVSGDQEEGGGFSMMVIALLPHLINNFGEPDQACCECAQNITQVCVDDYKDKKKLQSLAHVMSLYSNRTYGKQCLTWVNVVCKYIHETFPYTIRQQLTFLVDLLEKGPASCHQPCLQIIHSLLSFSDILLTKSSPGDVKLGQDVLRSVSKYISNVKHWKEALNVLKLAVSRCSEITSPSNVGFVSSSSLSGDIDRIELPGRTLAFEFDVTGTPVIGKSTDAGTQHAKRGPAASLSHHMSMTSPPTMGWKRPHLSQRRTHEKLLPVLSICGQHLPTQSDITLTLQANRSHLPDGFSPTSPQSDNDSLNEDAFEQDDDEQSENCEDEEDKGGVDDICVLRNFDFLDELEDNEDGFALIQNQTSSKDAEVGTTEDDPDTYNLTPHHDTSQDLDQSTIIEEEDEEIENETAVPEKYLESDDSSISTGSSVISINGNNGNMADDDDGDELSSIARKNGNLTASGRRNTLEKRHSVATTSETTKSLKHIGPSSSTESFGINSCQLPRAQSHNTVVSAGLYQSTISPIPSEMLKSHSQRITRSTAKNRFTSSQQSCDTSDSEVDRSPLKSSSNDLSEDVEDPLVGNHADFRKIYTDIPHTLPPPLSDISSEPVDIPIVAPPPVDDLISATSPTHSEPATYSRIASSAPLRHVVSDWFPNSTPRSRDKNNSSALRSASVHSTLSTSHTAFTAQKKDKSTPLPGSHCTLPDLLTTRPPWKAPSPLPPDLESRWQRFIDSVATQNASSTVGNTFDLFPLLFQVLCVDFSQLSKEGCRHLGSQLSNIAGHFSSMVEQLPSQIQCPLCLTSKGAINPVFEQLKFGVLELQEHLESYNTKKKNTLQCLEMVKELQMRRRFPEYADHKSSSHEDQETLGQKRSQSADSIGLPSASYSYAFTTEPVCTYPALLKCQLELCRLLYKLHFQLLLLLKSFNKLIQLVTGSLPENKNITDEISPLHKKLLSAEAEFREQYKQNKDAEQDILAEIKSMTQDEAENTLVLDVAEGRFKFAISQLLVLRDIWPPEIFGVKEDPVTDYLTKVYFKHLQSKNEADCCYAVLGRDDVARGMCERLMEVNSQIQQSLQSLSVIAPASDAGSTSSDKKSKTTRRTLL